MNSKKIIVLSGGGTLGSVTPLLALAERLKDDYKLVWLGTKGGVEEGLVRAFGLDYYGLPAGKLRRYFSWKNFTDLANVVRGFMRAWLLMRAWRPVLFITAGSYVSFPAAWAAKYCDAKVLLHQLDYKKGLANRLMSPVADRIAIVWQKALKDYGAKAIWTGSIISRKWRILQDKSECRLRFGLAIDKPTVLVMGGGTGASGLNSLTAAAIKDLCPEIQVLHLTGKRKDGGSPRQGYRAIDYLSHEDMAYAFGAADLVVSRAGMGSLMEIAFLKKPAVIVPMPGTHQELNAAVLAQAKAAVCLNQTAVSGRELAETVRRLITNNKELDRLSANVEQTLDLSGDKLLALVKELIG